MIRRNLGAFGITALAAVVVACTIPPSPYKLAQTAYLTCLEEKGAEACQTEREVYMVRQNEHEAARRQLNADLNFLQNQNAINALNRSR